MARFVEIMIVEDEDRVRESFRLAFAKYPGMIVNCGLWTILKHMEWMSSFLILN